MSSYVPTQQDVESLLQLLRSGLNGTNSRAAHQELQRYQSNPQFCILLSNVFGAVQYPFQNPPTDFPWEAYRQICGLTLKNNVQKAREKLGEEAVMEAARVSLKIFSDEANAAAASAASGGRPATATLQNPIAVTACQIISKVTAIGGISWWQQKVMVDLPSALFQMLDGSQASIKLGILCLRYIIEDGWKHVGESVAAIVNKAGQVVQANQGKPDIEQDAFRLMVGAFEIGQELPWHFDILTPFQNGLCQSCHLLAQSGITLFQRYGGNTDLMKYCVYSFVILVDYLDYLCQNVGEQTLRGYLEGWISVATQWISQSSSRASEMMGYSSLVETVTHSCELLRSLLSTYNRQAGEGCIGLAEPSLQQRAVEVVQTIFPFMLMAQEELNSILENDHCRHRDVVMKRGKGRKAGTSEETSSEDVEAASLRGSASRCLLEYTLFCHDVVFPPILEVVRSNWDSPDWRYRDVVLNILGTASQGCDVDFSSYLPSLIPQLHTLISGITSQSIQGNGRDAPGNIIVTSTALWALSSYVPWMYRNEQFNLVINSVNACLYCMANLKESKRIQAASVSCLHIIVQADLSVFQGSNILSILQDLVNTMHGCLPVYHTRNLAQLCNLFATLIEIINDEGLANRMIDPLSSVFHSTLLPALSSTFQERYNAQNPQPNALVNKDAFEVGCVIADYLTKFSSPKNIQLATEHIRLWIDVLSHAVGVQDLDDYDLVYFPLDMMSRLLYALDANTLGTNFGSSVSPQQNVLQISLFCIKQYDEPAIRSSCCELILTLLHGLQSAAIPSPDVVLEALAPLLTSGDTEVFMEIAVPVGNLLGSLCRFFPNSSSVLEAMRLFSRTIRSDAFDADNLPCESSRVCAQIVGMALQQMPQIVQEVTVFNSIAFVLSLGQNDSTKAEATKGICQCFGSIPSGSPTAHECLPMVMKLIYSWQQSAVQHQGLKDMIKATISHANNTCSSTFLAVLGKLNEAYRRQLLELYR